MTRIDFYFNAADKLGMAVKLAHKAWANQNHLLIYTRDAAQLDALDRLLWTAQPTSFLPHCRAGHQLAAQTAILLTADAAALDSAAMPHHEVMLNLDPEHPPQFSRFERLLEIVSRDDQEDRVRARARHKFYRDRGYDITTVDLATLKQKQRSHDHPGTA